MPGTSSWRLPPWPGLRGSCLPTAGPRQTWLASVPCTAGEAGVWCETRALRLHTPHGTQLVLVAGEQGGVLQLEMGGRGAAQHERAAGVAKAEREGGVDDALASQLPHERGVPLRQPQDALGVRIQRRPPVARAGGQHAAKRDGAVGRRAGAQPHGVVDHGARGAAAVGCARGPHAHAVDSTHTSHGCTRRRQPRTILDVKDARGGGGDACAARGLAVQRAGVPSAPVSHVCAKRVAGRAAARLDSRGGGGAQVVRGRLREGAGCQELGAFQGARD